MNIKGNWFTYSFILTCIICFILLPLKLLDIISDFENKTPNREDLILKNIVRDVKEKTDLYVIHNKKYPNNIEDLFIIRPLILNEKYPDTQLVFEIEDFGFVFKITNLNQFICKNIREMHTVEKCIQEKDGTTTFMKML